MKKRFQKSLIRWSPCRDLRDTSWFVWKDHGCLVLGLTNSWGSSEAHRLWLTRAYIRKRPGPQELPTQSTSTRGQAGWQMGSLVMCGLSTRAFCTWDTENIKEENKLSFWKVERCHEKSTPSVGRWHWTCSPGMDLMRELAQKVTGRGEPSPAACSDLMTSEWRTKICPLLFAER